MEQNKEFYDLAENIQKDCHEFTMGLLDEMYKTKRGKKNFHAQDAINIFFYKKLADIELRLRELERRTTISDN